MVIKTTDPLFYQFILKDSIVKKVIKVINVDDYIEKLYEILNNKSLGTRDIKKLFPDLELKYQELLDFINDRLVPIS